MSKKALQKVALSKVRALLKFLDDTITYDYDYYLQKYPQETRYSIDQLISSLRSAWDDYYILSDWLEEHAEGKVDE